MNQSSKSLDNLTRETLTSGENYLKYIEKATSTKTQYFSSLTAGISAMVSKIELSELNDQTTIQSLFNVVNNEWSSANKSTKKLEAFYENSRRYGEGAQSLTMSKHLEYSGANEMELQSKKINLSNALQQATNLDKESAANNWTTQLKENVLSTEQTITEIFLSLHTIDQPKLISKLHGHYRGSLSKTNSLALTEYLEEDTWKNRQNLLLLSTLGVTDTRGINNVTISSDYGVKRELRAVEEIKNKLLKDYLKLKKTSNKAVASQ
jgi:hypothetical protein